MSSAASWCRARCACAAIVIVVCPYAARGQTQAVPATPAPAGGTLLDPNSPMAPLPDLGVDWPDLAKPDAALGTLPVEPTGQGAATAAPPAVTTQIAGPAATTDATGDRRYVVTLEGLDRIAAAGLRERFDTLSSLRQDIAKPANVAQIDRRAREDADLLRDLLRAYGYYDAEVDTRIGGQTGPATGAPKLEVTLAAVPGPAYSFASVAVPGIAAAGADAALLTKAFGVHAGDPVDADKVNGGIAALKVALGANGYAFATVATPDIEIDHESHSATLTLAVDPGRQMRFGAFHLVGAKHVFGPKHIQLIARLHPGDRYNEALIEDLRRALIQTGLVSVAQVTPIRTADPQIFDLDVHLEPAPPRTVSASLGYVTGPRTTAGEIGYLTTSTAGTLGYGSGQGITAEADWTHRNLFPPEGSLTLRGVLGTQEQLASAIFRRNNFRVRDQALVTQFTVDHLNVPAFEARTVDLAADIERQTNIIWQKAWVYSYGLELAASDERDVIQATGQPRRRTYYIAAIPLSLSYDGSDDLLNPTRGFRLAARVSPEISFRGKPFEYVRLQLDGSAYQPLGDHLVFAERIRLGSIQGANSDDIAPTRRFYSGGGGSVRGFGYQDIGPRDVDNNPVGGSSLAEFGLEARIRFGNFGVVPFLDGGNLYSQSLPKFTGLRYGTGLGFRYYTSFGPVRVDVGTPINRQAGDSRVAVYVSLGQAF
jgi:translocation and assembly module TamA